MPCKRKLVIQPDIPNFDELMNFPLTVMTEDSWGNERKMYMDAKLKLLPANELSDSNLLTPEKISKTPKRKQSILKEINKEHNNENIVKRVSFSKVMFSSPLVTNTPNVKSDLRKEMLIERLKRCQETPILGTQPQSDYFINESSEFSFDNGKPKISLTGVPLFSESFTNAKDHSSDHNEKSFQIVNSADRKKWLTQAKRRSRWIRKTQGINDSFWEVFNVDDSESVILKLCATQSLQTFAKIFPLKKRCAISKVGEGSFGEVFSVVDNENNMVVAKFVPVEGEVYYNGCPQTTFDDIISEIIVAKELSDMNSVTNNMCRAFVQLKSVALAVGKFPTYFLKEWQSHDKEKPSENDNPKKFGSSQKWIILQFEFAGCPLENFKIESWGQAYSIIVQTSLALACAENYLEFEHRDLHWGNLLILKKEFDDSEETFIVNGKSYSVYNHGVQVTIIDYTFSRIKKRDHLVFTDMSKDEDIFLGTGDIQFDVYREMQQHNKKEWSSFNPKTNIFWLSYLGSKLQHSIEARNVPDDEYRVKFKSFLVDMKHHKSANHLVKQHLD